MRDKFLVVKVFSDKSIINRLNIIDKIHKKYFQLKKSIEIDKNILIINYFHQIEHIIINILYDDTNRIAITNN